MSEEITPAGAGNQPPSDGTGNPSTPPAAASGGQSEFKERLARLDRKHQKAMEAAIAQAEAEGEAKFRAKWGLDDESLEEWQNKDKTAAEKRAMKGEVTRANNEAAKHKARADAYRSQLDKTLRHGAIVQEAVKQGSRDPNVVAQLLNSSTKLIEQDGRLTVAVIDESGEATDSTIADAVKNLLAEKDYLAGPVGTASGSGSRLSQHRTADEKPKTSTAADRAALLQPWIEAIGSRGGG